MPLRLRRNAFDTADKPDFDVLHDEDLVGRLYYPTGYPPQWYWTLLKYVPTGALNGRSDTRDQAMAEFRAAWDHWLGLQRGSPHA